MELVGAVAAAVAAGADVAAAADVGGALLDVGTIAATG